MLHLVARGGSGGLRLLHSLLRGPLRLVLGGPSSLGSPCLGDVQSLLRAVRRLQRRLARRTSCALHLHACSQARTYKPLASKLVHKTARFSVDKDGSKLSALLPKDNSSSAS